MDSPPTPDEPSDTTVPPKPQTLAQCHAVIDALGLQIAQLREQMNTLQERLKLNSRNSSKPPSSDGPGSGGNRAQRRASGRTRGAQPGHKGSYRVKLPVEQVSTVHECRPPEVCECGGPIKAGKPLRHQVWDVPAQIRPEVQEYRLYQGVCQHCGKTHASTLPAGVPRSQIGPRALALVGLLGTQYHLTQPKIRDLLAQTMGLDFSVGAISQAHARVSQALQAPVAHAAGTLRHAPVVHMDETGYPREGRRSSWAWAVVQPRLAIYSILPSRARYVAQALIGDKPAGWLVSDRYAAYHWVDVERRQVCWAHLLRDFRRMGERAGRAGRIGRRLLGLGYVMFRWRDRGRRTEAEFAPLQRRIRQALEAGVAQTRCKRSAATCANLLALWPALWGFVRQAGVEPTNNAAEQALRTLVLKRKISGLTRSRRGEEFIARGYTVVESCRRQGRDALDFLRQALQAYFGGTAAPSLVPSG